MRLLLITVLLSIATLTYGQSSWYISQQHGSDANSGATPSAAFGSVDYALDNFVQPGDTLFLVDTFTNASYDADYTFGGDITDPHLWHAENTVRLHQIHGLPGQYITLKGYDEHTLLRGDGGNIFRATSCSYLRIENLDIEGEVARIPLSTAQALQFVYDSLGTVTYRVAPGTPDSVVAAMSFPKLNGISRPSYTDTRGLYISNVHHIDIVGNHIHDMPGGGLRVAICDYINITGNEVDNCSRKSYSGTHGFVVTKATSIDNVSGYKIKILANTIHHNYNEIYSWSPQKTIITPHIDEGKGISLQRNDTINGDWRHGRILIANNIAYYNGFSGIHSNDGHRIDMINNTCYLNSYTKSIYLTDYSGQGGNVGISASGGSDISMRNNISVIDSDLTKSALSAANVDGLVVSDNLIYGTTGAISEDPDIVAIQVRTQMVDPLFEDASAYDFRLQAGSPALDTADAAHALALDFANAPRDGRPDLGALERQVALPVVLLALEAEATPDHTAMIQWQTLHEVAHSHFVVWHATDAAHWSAIATVDAQSTATDQRKHYRIIHNRPAWGVNYYRLEMVAEDGTSTWSDRRAVVIEQPAITAYPNPTSGLVHIIGVGPVHVYDATGRQLVNVPITITNVTTSLDFSGHPVGMYWVCCEGHSVKVCVAR